MLRMTARLIPQRPGWEAYCNELDCKGQGEDKEDALFDLAKELLRYAVEFKREKGLDSAELELDPEYPFVKLILSVGDPCDIVKLIVAN